ncbi:MAG TPA: type I restriction enzyme endonuclease domain-containing protein, partial [Thermoanaerobaculia bacterium]|nr:type I restriction enzyme endonuclease domain-containing protein [Thermoanaerobaculia bacterium]
YDALETNDSAVAVLGDQTLRAIAQELTRQVRKNATIDWSRRESVRAKLRLAVRKTLRDHGYPPDKAQKATDTVLAQAEKLGDYFVETEPAPEPAPEKNPQGTRQGKVVLVQHREIQDTDTGGHYTVKRYTSEKAQGEDGAWAHTRIVLRPDTDREGYEPIVLEPGEEGEVRVVAELLGVVG